MFVLLVDIDVKDGYAEKFSESITLQAKTSLETEDGCMRFEILRTPGDPNHFTLLEGYTDEATFNSEHRTTRHYAHYAETTACWVENKSRKVYERFWPEDWKRADRVRVCGVNRRLVLQVLPVEPGTIVLMDRLNP